MIEVLCYIKILQTKPVVSKSVKMIKFTSLGLPLTIAGLCHLPSAMQILHQNIS